MNKLDDIYADMMRNAPRCPLPPPEETQHQAELRFRQEVQSSLKEINEKLDRLIARIG